MTGARPDGGGGPPGYTELRHAAALVDRRSAGSVFVEGADARRYLESIVSQRIDTLQDGEGRHSLLLQPTGKHDVDFRILAVGDAWWLDTEPGWGAHLAESLRRFLIRVDVTVTDRSDGFGVLAVRGPQAAGTVADALKVVVPQEPHAHTAWTAARVVRADWPGLPGVDVVGPFDALDDAESALLTAGAVAASREAWEIARVEAGIPRQGVELTEATIAQEARLETDAVDFEKGCFLGQELVCRIKDRGHVNRLLRGLRIDGPVPQVDAAIVAEGREIGRITSAVESPALGGPAALGYLRREVEPGSAVVVQWDGGEARADVLDLPMVR